MCVLQVTGAKIVTNAKSPGAKCYGFVTMATTEEASKCIQHLHRTELHGRNISVERVTLSFFHLSLWGERTHRPLWLVHQCKPIFKYRNDCASS
jgi:RNA recognition motif-containing protein